MTLCIIKKEFWDSEDYESKGELIDRFLEQNCEKYIIADKSKLYKVMMEPIDEKKKGIYLHSTPPTLFDVSNESKICAYSYYDVDEGPSI